MEIKKTKERLQKIFDDVFLDAVVIHEEMSAEDVEEWDSLLQITIVVAVESEFNIRFRIGEVEATKNIGEFIDLINLRLTE
jgi:acyl carrier protein